MKRFDKIVRVGVILGAFMAALDIFSGSAHTLTYIQIGLVVLYALMDILLILTKDWE